MNKILFLFLLTTVSLFAQFDSLLFQVNLSPHKYGVVALGDQNNDGCDDILIYDCAQTKAIIFFGGSPMNTTPVMEITLRDMYVFIDIKSMDINLDGYQDIILSYLDTSVVSSKVQIYFGGNALDTIPDIVFHGPTNTTSFGQLLPVKDFNGDGKGELFIWDPYLRQSVFPSNGNFYIYPVAAQFDTIPYAVIRGDTLKSERLYPFTSGDIDGDGLTDLAIMGEKTDGSYSFIKFYKGSSDWNTTPFVTYYKNEHTFDPTYMRIIEDINGDKKDDILIYSYGSFYPYYYLHSILYGSIPIDTIPDIGLNTQNVGIYNNVSPGDINGDGYNDFLAGAGLSEQARLWVGGNPMPDLREQFWGGDENGYGRLIAMVGDVNGDGLDDICVGQAFSSSCITNGFVRIFKGDTLFRQPTGVKEIKQIPNEYYLDNPYPNPFNPVTVISYHLSVISYVSLKAYDILGKEIKVLVNEEQSKGKHELKFNASKLSSGVYFITLTATTKEKIYSATKKIILTK